MTKHTDDQAAAAILSQYNRTLQTATPTERELAIRVCRLQAALIEAQGDVRKLREPVGGPLTVRQREVLVFLRAYQRRHGVSPTFAEICDALHVKSESTVFDLVSRLQAKGYLRRERTMKRNIQLLPPAEAVA